MDALAFRTPDRSDKIIFLNRKPHFGWRDVKCCQLCLVQPDSHRKISRALDTDALHAFDCRQKRLDLASEIIIEKRQIERVRNKADIKRCKWAVCTLNLNDWRFRLAGQFTSHLIEAGCNFSKRITRVMIQPQMHGNHAHAWHAGTLDVIDSIYC